MEIEKLSYIWLGILRVVYGYVCVAFIEWLMVMYVVKNLTVFTVNEIGIIAACETET
jgi:hypothetical protein